jgi:hypothetical protein
MADWLDSVAERVSNHAFARRTMLQAGGLTAMGATLPFLFPDRPGAATYRCSCGNCKVATINQSAGTAKLSDCKGTCVAESLCRKTVRTASFKALASALASRGFVPAKKDAPQAVHLVTGKTLFGTVLALPFQGSSKKHAVAIVFTPSSGPVMEYALAYSSGKFLYLLQANAKGKIISHGAPKITLPKGADAAEAAARFPVRASPGTAAMSQADCEFYTVMLCDVTAFVLGTALGAGICGFVALTTGGIAAAACPWIFGVLSVLLLDGTQACSRYAHLLCTTQFIYCNCNKTDYVRSNTCIDDCKVSLGCFSGICGPQSAATPVPSYDFG